jgi:hypothetical protein
MADRKKTSDTGQDENPDPITGEPGSHPVGVGAGATGGAVAGAAVGGAIAGPVGAAVGGAVGAIAGGFAGKGAAELINPSEEERYWRKEYPHRPYARHGYEFEHFGPAYRYGWESAVSSVFTGRSFEDIEPELERSWSVFRGPARTEWSDVREASRDAFTRVRNREAPGVTSASEKPRR